MPSTADDEAFARALQEEFSREYQLSQPKTSSTTTTWTKPVVVAEVVEDEPVYNLTSSYPAYAYEYEPGSAPTASMEASHSRTARTKHMTTTTTTTDSRPGSCPASAPTASMAASNSRTARTEPRTTTTTTTSSRPGSSPASAKTASKAASHSRAAGTKPPPTTTTTTTYSVPSPTEMVTRVQTNVQTYCNMYLGRDPQAFQCPFCHKQSVTRVRSRVDGITLLIVIVLVLFFWPLFWLPFCIPGCKSTDHYCSQCNQKIGTTDACE